MFTLIFLEYTSIVGRPKIMPHFSYTAFHFSIIKELLPHYENVRFDFGIHLDSFSSSLLSLFSPCPDSHAGRVLSNLALTGHVCSSAQVAQVIADVREQF